MSIFVLREDDHQPDRLDIIDDEPTTVVPSVAQEPALPLTGRVPSALVDLTALLSGGYVPPVADVGITTDGIGLFYRGRVNGLFGAPECGKTWIALWAAAQALCDGESALYVDADHNGASQILAWLTQIIGARDEVETAIAEGRLLIAEPDSLAEILEIIDYVDRREGVAVLDSIGELEAMAGTNADVNDRYLRMNRAVMTPLAQMGWTVITLDHVAKVGGGDSAIGASAKKRAANGAYYKVSRVSRFAPGRAGSSRMSLEKDRCGGVASALADDDVTFEMDADGRCSIYACELAPSATEPSVEEAILDTLAQDTTGLSARDIRQRIRRSDIQTRAALKALAKVGVVRSTGTGAKVRWHRCD